MGHREAVTSGVSIRIGLRFNRLHGFGLELMHGVSGRLELEEDSCAEKEQR